MSAGQTQTTINPDLGKVSTELLGEAKAVAGLPFVPNRGVQQAAFTPDQNSAFANTRKSANAFGLSSGAAPSMPQLQETNGIQGYTTGGMLDNALAQSLPPELQAALQNGGLMQMMQSMFGGQQQAPTPTNAQNAQAQFDTMGPLGATLSGLMDPNVANAGYRRTGNGLGNRIRTRNNNSRTNRARHHMERN